VISNALVKGKAAQTRSDGGATWSNAIFGAKEIGWEQRLDLQAVRRLTLERRAEDDLGTGQGPHRLWTPGERKRVLCAALEGDWAEERCRPSISSILVCGKLRQGRAGRTALFVDVLLLLSPRCLDALRLLGRFALCTILYHGWTTPHSAGQEGGEAPLAPDSRWGCCGGTEVPSEFIPSLTNESMTP